MPLEEICILPDRDCVKYILYYVCIARFGSLGNVFLTQLECIHSSYQEGCTTVCQLFENPVLYPIYLMLLKDQRFENYMVKYSREKVNKEMDKLISSPWL